MSFRPRSRVAVLATPLLAVALTAPAASPAAGAAPLPHAAAARAAADSMMLWDHCDLNSHVTVLMRTFAHPDRHGHLRTLSVNVIATPSWTNRRATPDKRYTLVQLMWNPPYPGPTRYSSTSPLRYFTSSPPPYDLTIFRARYRVRQWLHRTRTVERQCIVREPNL